MVSKARLRKKEKNSRVWDNIPSMIEKDEILRWLRPYLIKSLFSNNSTPLADMRFLDKVDGLSEEDRLAFILLLINTRDKHRTFSDFAGVVAIPVFLGCFALAGASDETFSTALVMYGIPLVVYLFMYYYSRSLTALLDSCTDALEWKYDKLRK